MTVNTPFVRVAVPVPLRRTFDYQTSGQAFPVGARVRVPFGRRSLVGVVVGEGEPLPPGITAKPVKALLDEAALLPESLLDLLSWASNYYHYPIGEVIHRAIPPALRQGEAAAPVAPRQWCLTALGREADLSVHARAKLKTQIIEFMRASDGKSMTQDELRSLSRTGTKAVARLEDMGWVTERQGEVEPAPSSPPCAGPALEDAQVKAVQHVSQRLSMFNVSLIDGVTGSGKTEVYLEALSAVVAAGKQGLVLVPEISLTPQLVARIESRLGITVSVLHSAVSSARRHRMWWLARTGHARVILGTRSAVFAPIAKLGIIIVDEEHDASYKQQEGFRYHGRDVAIMRARMEDIPIVLGSATPSLETMENVTRDRYHRLTLPSRAGGASFPTVHIVDLKTRTPTDGLSPDLLIAIERRLERDEQSLLFINRRGFAPVVMCGSCGWSANCDRCDARLTFHHGVQRLRCHHCGREYPTVSHCPECRCEELIDVGEGTERIESTLTSRYPKARILRLDRDVMTSVQRLDASLKRISEGDVDIIVGTQMVTKGHDFPRLTLVGVVNTDQALFSVDYRTPETLMQQLIQVSGRAGRGSIAGDVIVQTRYPADPVFKLIADRDYAGFLARESQQRRDAGFPPYTHLSLIRAESKSREDSLDFLKRCRHEAFAILNAGQDDARIHEVQLMDPVPSPMERRANRYRAQLLVRSANRAPLHRFLRRWTEIIDEQVDTSGLRWSLDIDPIDLY